MASEHTVGDLYIMPLNTHLPCSIPICNSLANVLTTYTGDECQIINMGNVVLASMPDVNFMGGVYSSAVQQTIQQGRTPNYFLLAVLPQVGRGSILVETFVYDARNPQPHARYMCPFERDDLIGSIGLVFQQVVRSMDLSSVSDDFYDRILSPSESDRQKASELAAQLGNSIGLSFAQIGAYDMARSAWQEVLDKVDPRSSEALLNIGQSYNDDGDFDEAEDWLSLAIEHSNEVRDRALAYYNRGFARSQRGEWNCAISDLKACISARPDFGMAYNNIGACFDGLGNRAEAKKWYRKCLALANDSSIEIGYDAKQFARDNLHRISAQD